jgi:protein-tyrosine phosphatase
VKAELFWVSFEHPRLAIAPRPRAGEYLLDEIKSLVNQGLDTIVSLLTESEVAELDLSAEEAACQAFGLRFISFPIEDRSVPTDFVAARGFLERLHSELAAGGAVGIHCRIGLGRSAMIAAALLSMFGVSTDEAFLRISGARGCEVPDTPKQRTWVGQFTG